MMFPKSLPQQNKKSSHLKKDGCFFVYLILEEGKMNTQKYAGYLVKEGYRRGASDLYFLPVGKGYELSYRANNEKQFFKKLNESSSQKLLLYFKYLAEMDVSEKRRTQLGAFSMAIGKKQYRMRLSTVADYQNRETLVIRFLYSFDQNQMLSCLFPKQLMEIEKRIRGNGLFLFSGPTGSGKTTTMYYLAQQMEEHCQVIAVEDPVEIISEDFLQLQTNQKIGLDYEELIKVCLRHRPDILIIGEIRDTDTAKMAIRAALTGHTVFSTVHAMNKKGVVQRLHDFGISHSELDQCLRGVIYQRLLPVQCSLCGSRHSVFCQHLTSSQAVLFDLLWKKNKRVDRTAKRNGWKRALRKAWSYGYITETTYEKFQI